MAALMAKADPIVLEFLVEKQPFTVALHPDEVGGGLTPRETGRLKQLAPGSAGLAMWRAISELDAEVLAALCVVAVERTGQKLDADKLFDGLVDWSLQMDAEEKVDPLAAVDEAADDEAPSITKTPVLSGLQPSPTTSASLRGG